ncbi:hypothetical protein [Nocardia sp. NBC_00416]|uniref:hypothetical protein n=1 Tax=Nocardia sp. NBC_00416 TaxID=2975991 RepID=UPI002E1B33FC
MTVTPAPMDALIRHFTDLRDGNHFGQYTRAGKESAFAAAVTLLDPPARQVLAEFDDHLLNGTGRIDATGLHRDERGGLIASWMLSWPEQRAAELSPISVIATYGAGVHHPHLRGATIREWPLNVAESDHATELIPVLRAIAGAEIHNLVFRAGGDWRIVPALHPSTEQGAPA